MTFIPFFVADRPMSLEILKTSNFQQLNYPMGIMSHTATSKRFQELFRDYPCGDSINCTISNKCNYPDKICYKGKKIRNLTIKMVDSGAFQTNGKFVSYEKLFQTYDKMGADYGIIYDTLRNKRKTIKSARKAMKEFENLGYKFNLVGVTQGKNPKQYLQCYESLKKIGYQYIAIGGLLKKNPKTARFANLVQTDMFSAINKIREEYPDDWLFALGCNNHKRLANFKAKNINLFGSDSKGWIFKYKKNTSITSIEEARDSRIKQVHKYIINDIYSKLIND